VGHLRNDRTTVPLLGQLQPQHQAQAARLGADVGVPGDHLAQSTQEPGPFDGGPFGQLVPEQDLQGGQTRGTGQGVPAKGGGMDQGASPEGLPDLGGSQDGPDGHHPSTQGLGQDQQIGLDAPVLDGKHLARAAQACLDLVGHHQGALAGADLSDSLQVAVGGQVDAAFALDRFQDDAGGFGPDGPVQSLQVAEGHVLDPWHQGLEGLAVAGAARDGQAPRGLAVEGPLGRHEPRSPGGQARELQRTLDRLGATVAEERILQVSWSDFRQGCCQAGHDRAQEDLGRHGHLVQLIRNSLDHFGVSVPQAEHAVASSHVQVFHAFVVPNPDALGLVLKGAQSGDPDHPGQVRVHVVAVQVGDLVDRLFPGGHTAILSRAA